VLVAVRDSVRGVRNLSARPSGLDDARTRAGARHRPRRLRGPLRADRLQHHAFEQRLIVELCGRDNEMVKLPPPPPVDLALLDRGLDVLLQGLRTIRRT
jgi:hypothetical protein